MWNWIKNHCQVVDLGVSAIAGLASLAIAFFAFQIDRMMQENALKEGRISRSVALAQGIISDAAVMRLLAAAGTIEITTDRRFEQTLHDHAGKAPDSGEAYKEAQVVTLAQFAQDNPEFRVDLAILLQHVRRAAVCIAKDLCDAETTVTLSGHVLHDIYFVVRPALTCDPFLKKTKATFYYSLIKRHWEQENIGNQIRIFLDQQELENAGKLPDDAAYRVIAFGPESFCDRYMKAMKDGQPGAMAGL